MPLDWFNARMLCLGPKGVHHGYAVDPPHPTRLIHSHVLAGFDRYGIGRYEALPTPQLQRALGFKSGLVSSGNSLDYTAEDMAAMTHHEAAVKEMEAAAVAWAASLFDCPMFCIKSITDIVDGDRPAQEEFLENLGRAAEALQAVVPRVLEFIAGKAYSEL